MSDSRRMRAEETMCELEELAPRLTEAYEAYLRLSIEWYDAYSRLRYYRAAGVVSWEELDRYPWRVNTSKKSQSQRLKEYRASRKEALKK